MRFTLLRRVTLRIISAEITLSTLFCLFSRGATKMTEIITCFAGLTVVEIFDDSSDWFFSDALGSNYVEDSE